MQLVVYVLPPDVRVIKTFKKSFTLVNSRPDASERTKLSLFKACAIK